MGYGCGCLSVAGEGLIDENNIDTHTHTGKPAFTQKNGN